MGPETENKQVNLFMKKPDGSYVYMGQVPEIKSINGVPIPTVTNETEAEKYMSGNELTLHTDGIYAMDYARMISKAWTCHLEKSTFSRHDLIPTKIIQNGPAFIVFWSDGTKTVLKRKDGDQDDPYAAFGQALMIKIFGNNSHAHKIVDRVIHYRDMEVVK